MNEILSQRKILASKLKKDIGLIYDTLRQIDIDKFNLNAKFKWKIAFTGYTDRVCIFIRTSFVNRSILVYDIEDDSCFIRLVENQDNRIFEAMKEANQWISGETELIKNKIDQFKEKYWESGKEIQATIMAYNSLKKEQV
jgi:hypothetical protein